MSSLEGAATMVLVPSVAEECKVGIGIMGVLGLFANDVCFLRIGGLMNVLCACDPLPSASWFGYLWDRAEADLWDQAEMLCVCSPAEGWCR